VSEDVSHPREVSTAK